MFNFQKCIPSAIVALISACAPSTCMEVYAQEREGDGFVLRIYDNSRTISRVLAINAGGAVLGVRETANQDNTLFSNVFFYAADKPSIDLPILDGFTNLEVESLSDNGLAVGFASRALGHADGSLTAIVWNSQTGKLTNLGQLPDERASHAQDISADGTRISGYMTGADPARLRPCVWSWNAENKTWKAEVLSTIELNNPYLMSSRAIISPDGQRVAACITEAFLPNGVIDSSLYVWDYHDGQWERRQISKEQMYLKSINHDGVVAGALNGPHGRLPVRIDLDGNITKIDLLPNDESGEACGINAAGTIVGFSDDPHGPEGGPQAFVWKDGKTIALALPKESAFSAAMAINDSGQIGGMADIAFPDQLIPSEQGGVPEPLVKTLGILWSEKAKK